MTIEFKNGSRIETIQDTNDNIRGERSNYYSTLCLDTIYEEQPVYAIATIDRREPLGRYIPVWMLKDHKHIQSLYEYRKRFDKNPIECVEKLMGIKLYWYQKQMLKMISKAKNIRHWF